MPGLRIHRGGTKRDRESERETERDCKVPVWIQYFVICALHVFLLCRIPHSYMHTSGV